MKRLLLFAMLLMCMSVFAQYEEEIETLNRICSGTIDDVNDIVGDMDCEFENGNYLCADYRNNKYYLVEKRNGRVVAVYIESYDRKNLKLMKQSVDRASSDYHYAVTSFRRNNAITITSIKK